MIEKRMRRTVIDLLKPLNAFAVENTACDGCPDICTVAGWIELKTGKWPAREETRVPIKVREAQRIWMDRWTRHGGRAFTLTRIVEWWFLHDAKWVINHLGNVPEVELRGFALKSWSSTPGQDELIGALIGG